MNDTINEAVQCLHNSGYHDLIKIECDLDAFIVAAKLASLEPHTSIHSRVEFQRLSSQPQLLLNTVKRTINYVKLKRGEA